METVLTHQTSLLGCVGPGPKVVAPVGPVVEQAQCDLGDPRLVGRATHSNKWYQIPRFDTRNNFHGSHGGKATGEIVGFSPTLVINGGGARLKRWGRSSHIRLVFWVV